MKTKGIFKLNKSKELHQHPLTVERCRIIFGAEEHGYTDEELVQMHDFLYKLASIFYQSYTATLRNGAKVISINEPYDTEKSHYLRAGKHRRAS